MRARVLVPGSAVLVLALAGCGGAEPQEEPVAQSAPPSETVDADASTTPAEPDDTPSEEGATTGSPEPTTSEETAVAGDEGDDDLDLTQGAIAVEDADFGDSGTNRYGQVIKEVGQWAGVSSADQELIVAALRVTDIEVDVECTSSEAEPSENSHYTAIDFEVQVAPEFADQVEHGFLETVWITPSSLWVYDEEGELETGNSGRAFTCLPLSDYLMPEIGPGETFRGYVVLDSDVEAGDLTLPLHQIVPGAEGAWAWTF